MFGQALFQFVDHQKKFIIFDEKLFVIFCDDHDDFVNFDDT